MFRHKSQLSKFCRRDIGESLPLSLCRHFLNNTDNYELFMNFNKPHSKNRNNSQIKPAYEREKDCDSVKRRCEGKLFHTQLPTQPLLETIYVFKYAHYSRAPCASHRSFGATKVYLYPIHKAHRPLLFKPC